MYDECSKRSKAAVSVDLAIMSKVYEVVLTPQVSRGKAAKSLKKRYARSTKKMVGQDNTRFICCCSSSCISRGFESFHSFSCCNQNPQKKLVMVPRDLPYIVTKVSV